MSGAEHTPVKLVESSDLADVEYSTQKISYMNEEVKVPLPIFDSQDEEMFIKLVNDYWNMVITYKLSNRNMTILFDQFCCCLGGSARTDWDNVVAGMVDTQPNLQNTIFAVFKGARRGY